MSGRSPSAADDRPAADSSEATLPPIVLVPGFLGKDTHWRVKELQQRHSQVKWITTQPGPMSSHHDRACELFYTLKGGRVDYGEDHSRKCGHSRFGRLQRVGRYPEWDASHPIDCVGHSIGGVTLRVLQHLLSARAFPGYDTSAAWLRSVTALASPLNGDPVVYGLGIPVEDAAAAATDAAMSAADACLATPLATESPSSRPPSPEGARFALPVSSCPAPCPSSARPALSPSPSECSLCAPEGVGSIDASSPSSPPSARPPAAAASPPSPAQQQPAHRVRLFSTGWLLTQAIHILSWLDWSPINTLVDFRLDHWQLSRNRHAFLSSLRALMRALAWQGSIGQGLDNAAYEVQPSATRAINARTRVHEGTVYVAFAARRAPLTMIGRTVRREPAVRVLASAIVRELMVWGFTLFVRLGGAAQRRAACVRLGYCPSEWAAHDGLLSVRGQLSPLGEASRPLPPELVARCQRRRCQLGGASSGAAASGDACEDADGGGGDPMPARTPTTTEALLARCHADPRDAAYACDGADGAEEAEAAWLPTGVWHACELKMDHFAVCGGPLSSARCAEDFWDTYLRVRRRFPPVAP